MNTQMKEALMSAPSAHEGQEPHKEEPAMTNTTSRDIQSPAPMTILVHIITNRDEVRAGTTDTYLCLCGHSFKARYAARPSLRGTRISRRTGRRLRDQWCQDCMTLNELEQELAADNLELEFAARQES